MKGKGGSLLKRIMAALYSKTEKLRIQFMIFFLVNRDKSMLADTLSHKLHSLITGPHKNKNNVDDHNDHHCGGSGEVVVQYFKRSSYMDERASMEKEVKGDLTEELLKESEEEEEDVDLAADMFIERFRKQMWLQKQHSLERNHQLHSSS